MSKRFHITHTLPDGVDATRETKASYAWVVVVRDGGTCGVWRWSETQASAVRYAASLQRKGFDATVEEINHGRRAA